MTVPPNMLQKRYVDGRQKVYFNDREAYLAGIYPDVQTLDGVHGDRSSIAAGNVDFGPNMERLARHTNNFFRHWVIFYPLFVNYDNLDHDHPGCLEKTESVTSAGEPWRKRYSPFLYTSRKKWDLNQYNDDYFLRLRKMIETAYNYGLVVQLMIFDRTGIDFLNDCLRWPYSPWNAKNNINKVIQANPNGVNSFYDRSLIGQIIYRDSEHPRPGDDDGGGGPGIVIEEITLGELQDNYVNHVVSATLEYPNVVYEIMNEPIHNPATPGKQEEESLKRVTWADTILGGIYGLTQGRRFIFYNDHTFPKQTGEQVHARGQDILKWKTTASLKNFVHLDGVIFHGDVKTFNPDKLDRDITEKLIVQVSTDALPDAQKEDTNYILATTNNAFGHDMMFQAEAARETTATAVGSAMPPPTLFKLPPFVSAWVKIAENPATNFPHLVYVQNADGTLINLNPDKDTLTMRGRVTQLDAWKLVFWNDLLKTSGTYNYHFRNNFLELVFERDGKTQVFRRYTGRIVPFVSQWEKVSENPVTQIQKYFLFFYPDNTFVTRRVSDFQVNNRGHVATLTLTQISLHSDTLNNDTTWNYSFTSQGQQLTLEKTDHSWTQVFRRV
jgi:hypothetical protein